MTNRQRFLAKVETAENGCWLWSGYKTKQGYGQFWWDGKLSWAHRFAHEHYTGEIPEGFEIDHLCRNPSCVNPEHLEPVTKAENARRGLKATKTHCVNGHEFTAETTGIGTNGRRYCRVCKRAYMRRRYMAQKNSPNTARYCGLL